MRKEYKRWLILKEFSNPPNPDFYCNLDGKKIGIEIAHLYGSERDARSSFGRERKNERNIQSRINPPIPLNCRIPYDLNRTLLEKANHNYGKNTWLVIRNAYPIWFKDDFEQYINQINIPRKHYFDEIWLICDGKGLSGILKLFPINQS
ncbi:MAG: hypothetical protein AB1491_07450 [Thermodesulfobacteriota bacterium]